jgi:hypothetical protein
MSGLGSHASKEKSVLHLFKNPLGSLSGHILATFIGVLQGYFKPEKPLKFLANLKNLVMKIPEGLQICARSTLPRGVDRSLPMGA